LSRAQGDYVARFEPEQLREGEVDRGELGADVDGDALKLFGELLAHFRIGFDSRGRPYAGQVEGELALAARTGQAEVEPCALGVGRLLARGVIHVITAQDPEVSRLESAGVRVRRIEPTDAELSAMGANFMNPKRRKRVLEVAAP
jgi:hypothetical protein